ncbi:polysaccharide deacetylase [Dyella thiooxydans]|uniref:Polysaccharide deacetylase n=2 Tax=Dyella thiooxydans TaxID=445710 RepID=A0A160N5I3_9GAMM|nr:polysaccharide deacetylase [Dyella thiooxydans]
MALLRRAGYTGLSMRDAMPYLRGERRGRVAVITLDDGYLDNLENALPALLAQGFTATCYVVSATLGSHNLWDEQKLGVRKRLMDGAQLRQWHDAGMEVGAHSRSHPRLTRCDEPSLRDEIAGSRAELEDVIGATVNQFCYPYGDTDQRVAEAARQAGYEAATATRRGRARPGMDLFQLPRVQVARHHWLLPFAQRVFTAYEDRRA